MRATLTAGLLVLATLSSGCATWDRMDRNERGLAAGAAGGAIIGGILAGPLGVAIGAGAGGYAGTKSDTIKNAVD